MEDKDAEWERKENVSCVECPNCLFTFAAIHTVPDTGTGEYLCPECGFPEAAAEGAT